MIHIYFSRNHRVIPQNIFIKSSVFLFVFLALSDYEYSAHRLTYLHALRARRPTGWCDIIIEWDTEHFRVTNQVYCERGRREVCY